MKKVWKIGLLVLLIPAVLAALIYGSGYFYSFRDTAPPELPAAAALSPTGDITLGSTVHATVTLELPLYRRVLAAELVPDEGVAALAPEIAAGTWRWDRRQWTVQIPLRPLKPGTVPAGKLRLKLSGRDGGTEQLELPVPPLEIKPLELQPDTELAIAGELAPASPLAGNSWLYWVLAAAVLAAVLFFWRKRRASETAREIPPWESTLAALELLRDQLKRHELPLESAWVRLTDLVRNYLEARFQLPVSTRTTVEFLRELDEPESPLPTVEKRYLRDFMTAADLVKFAKLPPDEAMILEATQQAEKLVISTRPEEAEPLSIGGEA